MEKLEEWLETIDCEGELELISSKENAKKFYRLSFKLYAQWDCDRCFFV